MFSKQIDRTLRARGFMAVSATLAMALALMVKPLAAEPFAYVTNQNSNTVSVIDTATTPPSVVTTVTVGGAPTGIAFTPDRTRAYVTNARANTVTVLDTTKNPPSIITNIAVGNFPAGITVTPDGKHAYVANQLSNTVSVIDTATNKVEGSPIAVGTFPLGVAVAPDGKRVYVTNFFTQSGGISVIREPLSRRRRPKTAIGLDR
jgi:YVTN family beta-propeller protein